MMINLGIVVLLVIIHTAADFFAQTDSMAKGKSSSNEILTKHVLLYSAFFLPFGLTFAAGTFVLHWCTDYVSSRLTTYYWGKENRHAFFCVIGVDQAIHIISLVVVYYYTHN
jgi:hypothetical protein